jgi:lipopolysaccharide/colanic/teichoic acid biosynthesis glycosyltransferase
MASDSNPMPSSVPQYLTNQHMPESLPRSSGLLKRAFDLLLSAVILVLMSPVMAIAVLSILLESGRPVFFSQVRVGRQFRKFRILKFRTMVVRNDGPSVTVAGDRRITKIGAILRKSKLDELPQFWNVIRGDMSIVGPRPEVPEYVDLFRQRYQRILSVRPGITDFASIYYRNEEELLSRSNNPLTEYRNRVLPAKLDLADKYIRERSAWRDLRIIALTALVAFWPGAGSKSNLSEGPKSAVVGE